MSECHVRYAGIAHYSSGGGEVTAIGGCIPDAQESPTIKP